MSPARKRWLRLLMLPAIAYSALVAIFMWLEESLIFPAPRYPEGDWTAEHLEREEVEFRSADGTPLHGWYFDHPEAKAHVLYCHGNGEHVAYLGDYLADLASELKVAVFVFDYRGYGKSGGQAREAGVLADSQAALEWLAQRTGKNLGEFVLVGRSLGGAVAVDLAARHGARGVILENTFTSIHEVAAHHYPWLPIRLLMRTRFDSLSKIDKYHGPLLQCHGDRDQIVPFEFGKALFEASPSTRKQFHTNPRGGHNDGPTETWRAAVADFIDTLTERRETE